MGKIGNAALDLFAAVDPGGTDELEQNPVTDDQECRHLDKGEKEKDRQQGKDPGMGIENQVGAHHPGHCAACADHRDARLGCADYLPCRTGHAADKIEDDEAESAKDILDIVAEYPEKKHI